jgi:hypothetical protein
VIAILQDFKKIPGQAIGHTLDVSQLCEDFHETIDFTKERVDFGLGLKEIATEIVEFDE